MSCQAAFWGNPQQIERVYGAERMAALREQCTVFPSIITPQNVDDFLTELTQIHVLFSTWGMFTPTEAQFEQMPHLRAVFYAAGSVQKFAPFFLERGITVVSSWAANAVPVAEFTLAQILLANKGYFRNVQDYKSPGTRRSTFRGHGNFGATVGLLGAGQIGRRVIEFLRPFTLNVLVFDPFLSDEAARALGVTKVSLAEVFSRSSVVSNHLANLPTTRHLLTPELLSSLPPNAVFINTGRGQTVDEAGMSQVLQTRPDLTALLDVTFPEPPLDNSPLWSLPNVHLSSHIAGALGDEVGRMADVALEEFAAWRKSEPLRYAVTSAMLETMA